MGAKTKYYVVWRGINPGIYTSWPECQQQIQGYPGAQYKSYKTLESARAAYAGVEDNSVLDGIAQYMRQTAETPSAETVPPEALPLPGSLAVDGACSVNPGPMEYRGVWVDTGRTAFRAGPFAGGTNNIAEYLAIVHALAWLAQRGDTSTAVYSDSRNAIAWVTRRHGHASRIQPTEANALARQLLERADRWLSTHTFANPVLKWQTHLWGETPADFGRK